MSELSSQKRLMDEAQVKEILGIDDFRKLDKNTVIKFISAIPQMNPEVAVKAIEQYPQMVSTALGIAKETKESYIRSLDANEKSSEATLEILNTEIEVLEKELQKDTLTIEE